MKELTGTGGRNSGKPIEAAYAAKSVTLSDPGIALKYSKNLGPSGISHSRIDSSSLSPETRKSSTCPDWPIVVIRA